MKLHYSQTKEWKNKENLQVLSPYEITLFSNIATNQIAITIVLSPYEITLFSNETALQSLYNKVLSPYEITLFSNLK